MACWFLSHVTSPSFNHSPLICLQTYKEVLSLNSITNQPSSLSPSCTSQLSSFEWYNCLGCYMHTFTKIEIVQKYENFLQIWSNVHQFSSPLSSFSSELLLSASSDTYFDYSCTCQTSAWTVPLYLLLDLGDREDKLLTA